MPGSAVRTLLAPRLGAALFGATLVWLLAACGGSEGEGVPTGSNAPRTGSLALVIAGLPGTASASVTVAGPGGFTQSVAGSTTLQGLAAGPYTITSADATHGSDRYVPSATSASVVVSHGATASATITYAIASGSINLTLSGLPVGADAAVRLTGPNGFSRMATSSGVIGGLAPGSYSLTAAPVAAGGHTWTPATISASLQVEASATSVPVSVSYDVSTGALTAGISGLPAGQAPSVLVTGPASFARTVAAGELITNLTPGTYTLTGAPVSVGADQYRVPAALQVVVGASTTPATAQLVYALASGRLSIAFAGLPQGANGSAVVTGPSGYEKTVTAAETITGLAPGMYTVTPSDVVVSGVTFGVAAGAQPVAVSASATPATASLTYAITKGALQVIVLGLPQSLSGSVIVTGPGGFADTLSRTTALVGLAPGTYALTVRNVNAGLHVYAGTPTSSQAVVTASATAVQSTVTYTLASGLLDLTVNGLPNGVLGNITLSGPGGYSQAITGSQLISGLAPGAYTITAGTTQGGGTIYAGSPGTQLLNIAASTSAIQATVTYRSASGSLNVTINGLPGAVNADVRVTGPGAYSSTLTATQLLSGLLPGNYTATASPVTHSGATYTASPASASATVTTGGTGSVSLTYTQTGGPPPPPPPFNLVIDGMHVQQVVQSYAGTVPLVEGKDGLLRVFVKASATNTAAPTVRVRFYNGATLQSTVSINPPVSAVPTSVSQASLSASWNVVVPAALMVPGLRILADVDPTNTVTESAENDNSWPTSGTPQTMDIRAVPSFNIRFVPVTQSANNLTGGVTAGNVGSYLSWTTKLFPTGTVNADVRAPYTTNAPVLQGGDGNGAWSQILSEMNALRTADGSSRYYAGIARVTYSSGIAGLGYVPGRATLSWDYLPSASEVVAHELGHNFGRFHAPCGGAGGPDPSYPYAGGLIGVYGYDVASSSLKAPTLSDLMGYCNNNWISDYTYVAVMNHRIANPYVAAARAVATSAPRRGLLVWGRISKGQVILEPAYEVNTAPSVPTGRGRHRLQAFGPLGQTLLNVAFDGERVADANDPTMEHFAFVLPLDVLGGVAPTRFRVTAQGRSAERRSTGADLSLREAPAAERRGSREIRVKWSDREVAGVMVRDARTGEILSFATGGDAAIVTSARDVDLVLSDGARSTVRRVRVR